MAGAALRGEVLSPPTRLDSYAELFHGLTPTAKCCRRIRGSTRTPGLALRGEVLSPPTRLNSNAEPFHGLTPTAKCGRRIRGLLEAPGWRPGDYLLKAVILRGVVAL